MRALGPGSVSSFLKIILDVAFYVLWFVIGCCGLASLGALLLSFNPDLLGKNFEINGANGPIPGSMIVAAILGLTLYLGGILVIVNRLRRIFQTLTAGDPFHPDNVRRLRVIGLILAGLELGRYVFWGAVALLGPELNKAEGGLNLTTWFSVLVIFVLAEVFREGARLRREAELTI
ncbi:hypothetical protein QO010_003493 [Caulobacter ginsengisoli]|uniref:DUF2975 domain-containing protein n=1 Tax=Caulobacter ginsengisoli TaxID=400775 RepID=A0ABU0IXC8_9CAUL|nr:DUF2975 domain-containing protein [Caulobacter ginsengisoli]MDQ0465704.1 hypothetical protein [Caulobacter ginsengisoli]